MTERGNWHLWGRWIAANATGELVGLGTTFAVGFAGTGLLAKVPPAAGALASMAMMTSAGAIEGGVVGLAQWLVLARRFPGVARRAWVLATLAGAVVAWFLGSLPSTAMSLASGQASGPEPAASLVLGMAAAMGALAGLVLAFPQWLVLRHSTQHAWLWLPANAGAWLVGMPVIFAAVDIALRAPTIAGAVVTLALALFLTGGVVGSIHGAVLVRLRASLPAHVAV